MSVQGKRFDSERRLTVDFSAWLDQKHVARERFYREGLVVIDANVLLDLYRLTPVAREQIVNTLSSIGNQLWVPHQAAMEFSRNRKRVVEERTSAFKRTRQLLATAAADAVSVVEDAIEKLQSLRDGAGAIREWDPREVGLARGDLLARLNGVMDPALNEFHALEAEYDLHLKDMQKIDPLFAKLDELLTGKIGPGYPSSKLRSLVEEAHSFRFPNKMPPGYLDINKESQLRAAGDFILWCQMLDMASRLAKTKRFILFITKDMKADWWLLDAKGKPLGPRPELVQEMRDVADADVLFATLQDFISGTKEYFSSKVSDETIEELEKIGQDAESLLPAIFRNPTVSINLFDIDHATFDRLIHYLLVRNGYDVEDVSTGSRDAGFDFVATSPRRAGKEIIVQTKRYRRPVSVQAVYELVGILRSGNYDSAILFSSSNVTHAARRLAGTEGIEVVDGDDLIDLLADCGVNATVELADSIAGYENRDGDPRGPWRATDITSPAMYGSENRFPITRPDGEEVHPPPGRGWRFSKERFRELEADGRIYWGRESRSIPTLKGFISERAVD